MSKQKWYTLRAPQWRQETIIQTRNGKSRPIKRLVCVPGRDFLLHTVRGTPVSRPPMVRNGARECARRVKQMERDTRRRAVLAGRVAALDEAIARIQKHKREIL